MVNNSSQAGFFKLIKLIIIVVIMVIIMAVLDVDLAAWLDWQTWPDRLSQWWQWFNPYLDLAQNWLIEQWQNLTASEGASEDIETIINNGSQD